MPVVAARNASQILLAYGGISTFSLIRSLLIDALRSFNAVSR